MEFAELIKNRYSVRKFDGRKVEGALVEKILDAGRIAPTARNTQPQRVIVVDTEDAMAKFRQCTPYDFGAQTALIVCYDKEGVWKHPYDGTDGGYIDASIVATHMMLMAVELGLGTTWLGHFDPKKVTELFGLPENIVPVCLFPLGYAADDATPSERHGVRKSLAETVKYNDFR